MVDARRAVRERLNLPLLAGLFVLLVQTPLAAHPWTSGEDGWWVDVSPAAVSYSYARLEGLPAGVAGFKRVVFVGAPLEGRVLALSRMSGKVIGELPVPPNGFLLPFVMHNIGDGRLGVLDAGGLPSPDPFIPASPTIYEYGFDYHPRRGFTAWLEHVIPFSSVPIAFAEDFVRLDDGRYLLSDAIFGAIWIVNTTGEIVPGIVPETFDFTAPIPELMMCMTMPLIDVGGVPFLFTGSTIPGVSPLAVRHGTLFFYSPCAEGLYAVPIASLTDDRLPHERAADIRLVSAKPDDVAVEQLLGLTFNPFNRHDRYLYAADSLQLQIIRIDPLTGKRRVIADHTKLFNFPSSMGFLPPIGPFQSLAVVSNQQHLLTLTNDAISEDLVEPPFLVTKVFLRPGCRFRR